MKSVRLIYCTVFFLVCNVYAIAQRTPTTTQAVNVTGKVKTVYTINCSVLDTLKKVKIPDLIIYNHKGEIKDTLRNLQGVPLQLALQGVQYDYEKPRELSEFYFTFIASDGYKVVLSWNEIYNTEAGNQMYFITSKNKQNCADMAESMAFICSADLRNGRRYVKALQTIKVSRTE